MPHPSLPSSDDESEELERIRAKINKKTALNHHQESSGEDFSASSGDDSSLSSHESLPQEEQQQQDRRSDAPDRIPAHVSTKPTTQPLSPSDESSQQRHTRDAHESAGDADKALLQALQDTLNQLKNGPKHQRDVPANCHEELPIDSPNSAASTPLTLLPASNTQDYSARLNSQSQAQDEEPWKHPNQHLADSHPATAAAAFLDSSHVKKENVTANQPLAPPMNDYCSFDGNSLTDEELLAMDQAFFAFSDIDPAEHREEEQQELQETGMTTTQDRSIVEQEETRPAEPLESLHAEEKHDAMSLSSSTSTSSSSTSSSDSHTSETVAQKLTLIKKQQQAEANMKRRNQEELSSESSIFFDSNLPSPPSISAVDNSDTTNAQASMITSIHGANTSCSFDNDEYEEVNDSNSGLAIEQRQSEVDPSLYRALPCQLRQAPLVHCFTKQNRPLELRKRIPVSQLFQSPVDAFWKGKCDTFNQLQSEIANVLTFRYVSYSWHSELVDTVHFSISFSYRVLRIAFQR